MIEVEIGTKLMYIIITAIIVYGAIAIAKLWTNAHIISSYYRTFYTWSLENSSEPAKEKPPHPNTLKVKT